MSIKSVSEVLTELKINKSSDPKFIRDWREMIPSDSKWFPGCPGDPFCNKCDGRGYVRIEGLPIGHPYFGRIFFCDCADLSKLKSAAPLNEEYGPVPA